MNVSNINSTVSDADFSAELNNRLTYYLGVFAQIKVSHFIILRTELLYSLKGASYKAYWRNYQFINHDVLRYINLPLIIGLQPIRSPSLLSENLTFLFGAEVGYLFDRWTFSKDIGGIYGRIPSGYKPFDKALTAGVSYKFNSSLEVQARYNYGLKNIFSDIEVGANRVFQLGMAYHFSQSPAKTGSSKSLNNPKTPRYSF